MVSGDHNAFLNWPASKAFTEHLKELLSSRQILCSPMLNNYLVAFGFSVGPTLKKRFSETTKFASEQYSYRSNTKSTKTFTVFRSEAEERSTITNIILDDQRILFRIPSTVVRKESLDWPPVSEAPIMKRLRTERGAAVVAINPADEASQETLGSKRPQDNRTIAQTYHRRQSGEKNGTGTHNDRYHFPIQRTANASGCSFCSTRSCFCVPFSQMLEGIYATLDVKRDMGKGQKKEMCAKSMLPPFVTQLVKDLGLTEADTFYDLGCGNGSVVILVELRSLRTSVCIDQLLSCRHC